MMRMITTEITILVNRKSDIGQIEQTIIDSHFQFPVMILEYEHHYQLNFTSNYEEWELDSAISECFPDYELTSYLGRGEKEIRLQISRYQSDLSFDNWGRPIPDPLDETKYLVKKGINKPEKFCRKIRVLFEDKEQHYFVNWVGGINKTTDEKGLLLINDFKNRNHSQKAEILKDRLYKSPHEVFDAGYIKMQELINHDYNNYINAKKKELRKQQKLPRKIIRDFIKACNEFDIENILKNLHTEVAFEKRVNWQKTTIAKGIKEFEEYLNSPNQDLCSKEFKIRSNWNFSSSIDVTIGIKYYQDIMDNETETSRKEKLSRISFILDNNKIIRITKEDKY